MKIRTIKTKIFLPRENLLTFIERYVRLAAAAVLCMGEGRERCPLALISNAPINYVDRVKKMSCISTLKKICMAHYFGDLINNNRFDKTTTLN